MNCSTRPGERYAPWKLSLIHIYTAGFGKVLLDNIFEAYTRSGATLSVALYMTAYEEGNFEVAWAIAALLIGLVLIINLAARLVRYKASKKK